MLYFIHICDEDHREGNGLNHSSMIGPLTHLRSSAIVGTVFLIFSNPALRKGRSELQMTRFSLVL